MPISSLSAWRALVVGIALQALACSNTYCQSGPKYGTQCYTENDVEKQRARR